MSITLDLPIYIVTNKKKGTKMLLGYNQIINKQKHYKNYIKQKYQGEILKQLELLEAKKIKGKFKTEFLLYYPHSRMDISNICSMIDKYIMDALQEGGYIESDNVNNYIEARYITAERDKENPRCRFIITEVLNE